MKIRDIFNDTTKTKSRFQVNLDESLDNAASMMRDNKIKAVSVIDEEGNIVGQITIDDLIANSDELNEDFFLN